MIISLGLFHKFILRDLSKNWIRTLLTLCGIALGVAVLLAISLANHTAVSKFRQTVDLVSGRANLEIHSVSTPFIDESVLPRLQWLWMIGGKYTPLVIENVVYPGQGEGELVQLIGMDMLADPDFKSYQEDSTTKSSMPNGETSTNQGSSTSPQTNLDIIAPDTALVGGRLAASHQLKRGSKFQLLINARKHNLIVADVLANSGLGGAFSGNLIVTDISTAQRVLNLPGKITQIELIVPPDLLPAAREKLRTDLPLTLSVARPSQRGEQVEKMTRSFEYNLMALAFIALMVGMFLIYNTMTISIIRRRPEIGTMRALGTSKWTLFTLFLMESLMFGVVGSALGVMLGLSLAGSALKAVASTFRHFYFQNPVETVIVQPAALWLALAFGIGLTVVAAIPAVLEAMNVAPAEAARRASYERRVRQSAGKLGFIGTLMIAVAAFASVQPPYQNFPVFGYVAALFLILGCAFLMPLFLRLVLPPCATLLEQFLKSEGRLAARSLEGTLGRTSVAVASLMIGIAMMVSLAIMIGSFRKTVTIWIDQTLKADLWLQSAARAGGSRLARLDEKLLAEVQSVPGVMAVDAFVEGPMEYKGEPTNLSAGDFDVVGKYGKLVFLSGEPSAQVCQRVKGNSAVVSETFAIRKHVKQGDTLELESPHGTLSVRIEGVYYDYASDLGYIVLPRDLYIKYFDDKSLSSMAIYTAPGADAQSVRSSIQKLTGSHALLLIRTTGELRREAIRVFDRTFAVTYALHTIAITVAMLAVMNALFALTYESRRDFGILRYLGASERQLRKIVLVQAGLLGFLGNLTGLALGLLLSLLLIFVINKQSFGWTVQFYFPYDFLLQSSALVIFTAILAGIIPARLAARTPSPAVVRDE